MRRIRRFLLVVKYSNTNGYEKEKSICIYPDHIAKPVLYPLKTASGKVLTRGFPLDTIPGERVDHLHHVGHWMNYGDVKGLDFWNNSNTRPEEDRDLYGTIFHKEVKGVQGGDNSGILEVLNEWKTPDGVILLEEHTQFIFPVQGESRIIDRITRLQALNQEVSFKDNKEGMFAVRVTRAMELPSEKPAIFTDAHGHPTETKVLGFKLAPNESVIFKYRILVHSGEEFAPDSIHAMADQFAII